MADVTDLRLTLTVEGKAAPAVAVHGFGAGALTDLVAIETEHGQAAARDAALALAQTLARMAGFSAEFAPLRG